ncbi:hypothetical protein AAC387_Pa01g3038 [Persea americana]
MAYRRRQSISRASTFKEDVCSTSNDFNPKISRVSTFFKDDYRSNRDDDSPSPSSSSSSSPLYSSLAAQATRASSARRGSPLSAHSESAYRESNRQRFDSAQQSYRSPETESHRKAGSPRLQKGLDAITYRLNSIGDTIGNALEEGRTIVETRTADIISETRKLHIRRKGSGPDDQNQDTNGSSPWRPSQNQADQETQLKASRDVAMAMAAKAKLLLRELKTMKADLAFAKERCAQLEEENKVLRECHEKGVSPEEDDLIRLQLETLLAEKSRLANENSIYARENRFLREVVEYHQLTMQDVIYVDEGIEAVTEVYPIPSTEVILDARPSIPPHRSGSAQNLTVLDTSAPIPTTPTSPPTAGTDVASPNIQVPASEDQNNRQHCTNPSSTENLM